MEKLREEEQMKKFVAASVVVVASAFCAGSSGLEQESFFAPGQIIVEFEPNVINLPVHPENLICRDRAP